ncbi:MAG TPA: hypothetical protein VFZ34_20675 [Blastocatellia bacterium]|nr:hypothetical protein [Blastocatellia bacterium]
MKTKVLVATSLVMLTVVSFAWAPSPTLQNVRATLVDDKNLRVSWEEINLPPNTNVTYAVNAAALATYACVNSSGNCPGTEYVVRQPVGTNATYLSSKRGVVYGTVTMEAPVAPSTFTCAGGQTMVLSEISYRLILVQDLSGPSKVASPSSMTETFACN